MAGQEINYEPKFLFNESAETGTEKRERDPDLRVGGWNGGGGGGGVHVLGTSMHGTLRSVVTERFSITRTHASTEARGRGLSAHAALHGRRTTTRRGGGTEGGLT